MSPTRNIFRLAPVIFAMFVFAGCRASWPEDKSAKIVRLTRCAELVRSGVDTNQIEMACRKITNQPESVLLDLKQFSKEAVSVLNLVADQLTNPKLTTFTADFGDGAELLDSKSQQSYIFVFYFQGAVLKFELRRLDIRRGDQAYFYKSGKLRFIQLNKEHSNARLDLNEDGTFYSYWSNASGRLVSFYADGRNVPPEVSK
jgi:hypothetical protein